jgi:hypothetical protein
MFSDTTAWTDDWRSHENLDRTLKAKRFLIAAGMVLRGHENQTRTRCARAHLRCSPASLKNANHSAIGSEYANPDGKNHREAEDQRHEERNHDQSPLLNCSSQMLPAQLPSSGFFNLPSLTLSGIDD